ncbi:MAG: protein kinase [Phycisphaera sp.]|nr:protein kinase [Phycisphaera sp.]
MSQSGTQSIDPVAVPHIDVERIGGVPCVKCRQPMRLEGLDPLSSAQCPHCGTVFSVPCRLDEYVLLRALWEQAGVWTIEALGKDKRSNVLIQVFRGADHSQTRLRYFLRDVQRISKVRHPNIVHVLSMNTNQTQPYVIMDRAPGFQLAKFLAPGRLMREANALQIGLSITEALAAADQKKYVHGDVSSYNVMVDEQGHTTLFNFGWDRIMRFKTDQGIVGGHPWYVAPEKIGGDAATRSSDIYSLGAVIYHMLAGQPPFQGDTDEETALMRQGHLPPDLEAFRDDLNPNTIKLINGLMQPRKQDRYKDFPSILRDIRKAIATESTVVREYDEPPANDLAAALAGQAYDGPAGYHGDPSVFDQGGALGGGPGGGAAGGATRPVRRTRRRNDPTLLIIVSVVLIVGLIIMVVLLANAEKWRNVNYRPPTSADIRANTRPAMPGADDTPESVKRGAYDEAVYTVRDALENGDSADFVPLSNPDVTVTKYPNHHYNVKGYVTSKDDSGASVRRRFTIEVWPTNKEATRWKSARPTLVVE